MSKLTFAIIAAGGAAAGAAATAVLYSSKKESSPSTPIAATTSSAAAAQRRLVDPNGLFQYGFPGPVNDLRPAASLTSSYDRRTRNPAWVAEHITPESLAHKSADRKNS